MASNNTTTTTKNNNTRKRGVDAILQSAGKSLKVGESCSFRLIKGPPTHTSADPVDAKAPHQTFPLMAKFPVSVVKPEFEGNWKTSRMYQCDIPKPEEDSDDEALAEAQKKKRWKYNRPAINARQWILQEQVDFLETMVAKREKKTAAEDTKKTLLSSRYEGVPEHNASHYVLVMMMNPNINNNNGNSQQQLQLQIRNLPTPHGTIPFAQPAARHSFSLSQAEQAIQDQRSGIRTLRADANAPAVRSLAASHSNHNRNKQQQHAKSRLMQKFKQTAAAEDAEEADDVMGDVTFRQRKGGGGGGGSAARRELLASLGDGVAVSSEGVLGGTNDAAFGGRNRFGQLQVKEEAANKNDSKDGAKEERGADGAAMADDFYQRDVKAEYDELDYDANEQFDDDDVDLGESEVVVDTGGFGAGDDDEEDELEELDREEEAVSGAEGLASAAGFKAMLAKARGETPTISPEEAAALAAAQAAAAAAASPKEEKQADHMSKIMAAAEEKKPAALQQQQPQEAPAPAPAAAPNDDGSSEIQVDENGLRIISLDAVRREIWLNHGAIPMKRLMKMFEVKKKSSQERQAQFRNVVKELCTMKTDPVAGRMLVLKQHYSNMG